MTFHLTIDYWSAAVVCFDPEKVVLRFADTFSDCEIDPCDFAEKEVQSVEDFLKNSSTSVNTKETMRRQIRGKARRNGPVYNFEVPMGTTGKLVGKASRYSIVVRAVGTLDETTRNRVLVFLESLGVGSLLVDEDDEAPSTTTPPN